jgi:hypothetical protein
VTAVASTVVAWVAGLACLACAGCGQPPRTATIETTAPAEYPGVIHDPATLPHDFMVRQSLTIRAPRDGKLVESELDAVLQKQGATLLIVGFGPMNVKAFTLTQRGERIEFTQFMGPPLPFSPRNIVVDVHRVYFKRLPAPTVAGYSGVLRGELDGETVVETWEAGEVTARVFTRPQDPRLKGAIHVELGEGCGPVHCEPASATLSNEWFGYTLAIENDAYERL